MSVIRHLVSRQSASFDIPLDTLTPQQQAANYAGGILTLVATLFALSMIVVLLRVYVRTRIVKTFGIDDGIMIFAMLCCTVSFVCVKLRTDNGLGRYLAVVLSNPAKFQELLKWTYLETIFIVAGVSAVKISVALCLLRFSVSKQQKWILYGSIGFLTLLTVACCSYLIWECIPIEASWNHDLLAPPLGNGHGHCISDTAFLNLGYMNSVFNILTDAFFSVLPIPVVWKLQMNYRTKISLAIILSLGWFACVAAIIKLYQQTRFTFGENSQYLHDTLFNWFFVELTVGIIAASLPMLKPLLASVFTEVRQAAFRSKDSNSQSRSDGFKNSTPLSAHNYALKNVSTASNLSTSGDGYHAYVSTKHGKRDEKDAMRDRVRSDSEERILSSDGISINKAATDHSMV